MLASTPLYSLSTFPLRLSTKKQQKNNTKVRKIPGFSGTIQNTKTIQDEDHGCTTNRIRDAVTAA